MKKLSVKLLALLLAVLLPIGAFAGAVDDFRKNNLDAGKVAQYHLTFETSKEIYGNIAIDTDPIGDIARILSITAQRKDMLNSKTDIALGGDTVLSIVTQTAANGELFFTIPQLNKLSFKIPAEMLKNIPAKEQMANPFIFDLNMLSNPPTTGDAKMDEAIKNLFAKATVTDFTEESDKHDKAVKLVTLPVDNSDVLAILQSDMVQKQMSMSTQKVDMETVQKLYGPDGIQIKTDVKYYLQEDGTVIGMEMPIQITADKDKFNALLDQLYPASTEGGETAVPADDEKEVEEESKEESGSDGIPTAPPMLQTDVITNAGPSKLEENLNINGFVNYYRKTESVVTHSLEMDIRQDNKGVVGKGTLVVDKDNYKLDTSFDFLTHKDTTNISFNGFNTWEGNKANGEFNFKVSNGEGSPSFQIVSTKELANDALNSSYALKVENAGSVLNVGTVYVSESYVDKMDTEDYTTGDAFDVSKLDQASVEKINEQIMSSVQSLAMNVLGRLPASVQQLLMGGMGN